MSDTKHFDIGRQIDAIADYGFEIKNLNNVIARLFWNIDTLNKRVNELEQLLKEPMEK